MKVRQTIKAVDISSQSENHILLLNLALLFYTFCSLGLIQNLHLVTVSIFSEGLAPSGSGVST